MTGEVINPDPDHPQVFFSKPDEGITWPSTDTGDPVFPPRTPARRSNTTGKGGLEVAGGGAYVDDKFVNDFFLQGTTHLDAIGHAWYGSEIYNGYPAETTRTLKEFETTMEGTEQADSLTGDDDSLKPVSKTRGLAKADASNSASAGVAGRGVLLDVGRQFGDEKGRLPLEAEVTFDDLVKTADAQDVDIRERDILLVRTGAIARTRDPEAKWGPALEPGLVYSEELVQWIHEMDIPYIGADNLAVEKVGQVIDGETITIPLHSALLRNLGVYLNEVLWLEDLGVACAEDGIYDFLFTGAPLKVERASGAPINPVILKATDECEDDNHENDE
jgi:kynurenine formamidase